MVFITEILSESRDSSGDAIANTSRSTCNSIFSRDTNLSALNFKTGGDPDGTNQITTTDGTKSTIVGDATATIADGEGEEGEETDSDGAPAPLPAPLPPADQPPLGPVSLASANFDTGRPEVPESTVGGESTCIICFTRPKSHVAIPCGHLCACDVCSARPAPSLSRP